jgi:ribosomal protein S18 acetylase RimI-like enzyme
VTQAATVTIEHWRPEDGAATADIARLVSELGYPVGTDQMAGRLARLANLPGAFPSNLLLARDAEGGEVVGLLHVVIPVMIEMDAAGEIWGLVVDSRQRGNRIGQRLVEAAEIWAREKGVSIIRLRTNVNRADAHRFYERLGFERVKTSHTYSKSL